MLSSIHITGQTPENFALALAELKNELGFTLDPKGTPVTAVKGDCLGVKCDGETVTITWAEPIQFYRALSLIPLDLSACDIREEPAFQTVGVMFDCSRNAVIAPEALKGFLRKMALQGLNLGMMYTEDTYEVPEQPFFGYKRGRYTYDELKALDDYAYGFGIELIPCIQTLGHLDRVMRWPAYYHVRENGEIIEPDREESYEILEQMIRAAAAPYRSKRIHLGMDEAWGLGSGAHLIHHGYENPNFIMKRHLKRLLDICEKYGLNAMMWSDMYFQADGLNYHSERDPSPEAIAAVDPRITLVYWDYYQSKVEMYDDAIRKHGLFDAPMVFAGGIWTWVGPAPAYPTTIPNTIAALASCRKHKVPLVFATCWGDGGQECNMTAALLGMQIYGEMAYHGDYDEKWTHDRFRRCCHCDPQAFLDLSLLNIAPGMLSLPNDPSNACKIMLYQDPLVQVFEKDMEGFGCADHFASLVQKYATYARENPEYRLFFDFYTALAHAVALKSRYHAEAGKAVREKDLEKAEALAQDLPAVKDAIEALRLVWRELWSSTNKPFGFEVIDFRMGGIQARLDTAAHRLAAFARGEVEDIPELSSETLLFKRRPNDSVSCTNVMDELLGAARQDHPF